MDKDMVLALARDILLATARIETNGVVHAQPATCISIAEGWIKFETEYLAQDMALENVG